MIETEGWLSEVALRDGALRVEGWVASRGAGSLDELRILIGGEALPGGQLTRGLPSPDVAAAYPGLDGCDAARFRMVVPLAEDGGERIRDRLLRLVPMFDGRPGWGWFRLLDPKLPFPSEASIGLVGGDFLGSALDVLGQLVHRAGLEPGHDVLDVGCGTGRVAYVLTHYLAGAARYQGFDVVARLVRWAQDEITSRFPNFRFQTVDLHNRMYNPKGKLKADRFSFPCPDESFDVVLLASVFTHVGGRELRRYLGEIQRVLRPGGRSLCTCFVMTDEVHALIRGGRSHQPLVHKLEDYWTVDKRVPELAVGFEEEDLEQWITDQGLTIQGRYPGSWCGRGGTTYQDAMVLQKPPKPGPDPAGASGRGSDWAVRTESRVGALKVSTRPPSR